MALSRYDTLFETYVLNLALTKKQVSSINSKLEETLSLFLAEFEGDVDIFAQGSYAMGTTVRPLTANQSPTGKAGEYDIDIALERTSWGMARPTLQNLRQTLTEEYGSLVDDKERETCERVHHDIDGDTEVSFHVDYVPIKNTGIRNAAKRTNNEWFPSDTKDLIEWFEGYSDYYLFLPATVLMLKRMRDYANLTDKIPSICITALACIHYEEQESYGDDLIHLLDKIASHLSVPYSDFSISIEPVNDDLASKISESDYSTLRLFFSQASTNLKRAFESGDMETIRSVLSKAFPSDISDYPDFLVPLRSRALGIELNGSLKFVDIEEDQGRGYHVRKGVRKFFGSGETLSFRATEKDRTKYGVRWQVLNSEQSPEGSRRGNLFKARGADGVEGSSSNRFVNHEKEEYDGEHWIKYYTFKKSTRKVVEIGRKFYVAVEK